jgi:hypothetical protein
MNRFDIALNKKSIVPVCHAKIASRNIPDNPAHCGVCPIDDACNEYTECVYPIYMLGLLSHEALSVRRVKNE